MGAVGINKNNNKRYFILISLMGSLCLTTPHLDLQQKIHNNFQNNQIISTSSLQKLEDTYNSHQSINQNHILDLNTIDKIQKISPSFGSLDSTASLNDWEIDFSLQNNASASILDDKSVSLNGGGINFTKNSNTLKSDNLNTNKSSNISLVESEESKKSTASTIADNLSYKTSLSDLYKLDKNKEKINKLTNYISSNYKVSETEANEIVSSTYQQSLEKGVDPILVLSLIEVESAFNKNVKSKYGAVGLTQILPKSHPEEIAQSKTISKNISDVKANIFVGVNVLKKYLTLQKGNMVLALQAYNGSLKDKKTKYYKKIAEKQANLIQVASS